MDKLIPKFIQKFKKPGTDKIILKKKDEISKLRDFKTYYKASGIKILWYLHKDI